MVRATPAASSSGYGGGLEAEAQEWIEAVTGEAFEGGFADSLRDGVKLCKLLNTIKPGAVRRVNTKEGQNKFKQMENISNFIRGCREIGVKEYSLFETVDLYEGKDVGLVVKCLHALGGTAQLACPDFQGPHLGLKPVGRVSAKKAPEAAAKTWSKPSPSSSSAPAKSWSTPSAGRPAAPVASSASASASSGRPAAPVTFPSTSSSPPFDGSRAETAPAVTSAGYSGPAASSSAYPAAPPAAAAAAVAAAATEPPPPFDHSASTINGTADDEPPPPPPYNGAAPRWGSGEGQPPPAIPAAAIPTSAGGAGADRLPPPPAYREDMSSRFAESVRVADRSSGSVSPRGHHRGDGSGPGRVGVANGSSQATRPPSPPYRPPGSYGFSQQPPQQAATTAAAGRGSSKSPTTAASTPPPFGAARASNGHQQARTMSSALPATKDVPTPEATSSAPAEAATLAPSATVHVPAPSAAAGPVTVTVKAASATSATSSPLRSPAGGRGGGYGLDAELAAKREANYDYDAEAEAQEWIEGVTGIKFADEFGEELRNGKRLCELINTIKPGAVRRVNDSKMPFKQMENVSNFLKACRAVGVAEHSLFETVDLYEGKDLGLVVRCLHALGQTVQKSCPEYDGPRLGIMQTETNKREWTAEQQQQQLLNSSAAMSQLMAGSSKTMERGTIIKQGVTFGATQSGTGDPTASSGWTMGSASTMDRAHIAKSGPTFGAEYAGPSGDTSGMSSHFTGGRR
eukprot:g8337.t1